MSTILSTAKAHMLELHSLTVAMRNGELPSAVLLLGIQADLVNSYQQVSEEMVSMFSAKERAYLQRKVEQAKQHAKGRLRNMTSKDAEEAAFVEVQGQYTQEIASMETFELYRTFRSSLEKAIDHCRTVVSFLKTSEKNA